MGDFETPLLWTGFLVFIGAMVALDVGVFHRKTHVVEFREAALWTFFWMFLATCFGGLLYVLPGYGPDRAAEFAAGYLLELSLSVDNMFVFILVFGTFSVRREYQHRVLIWGILGAVILRGVFIALGAAIIERFHWFLYIFGVILLYSGGRLLFLGDDDEEEDLEKNKTVRFFRRILPLTSKHHGQAFFVVENGKRFATPLFLTLCVIEVSDLVFALDSIPATFGVTTNPFVVFTSNMFAILGLRSLFFIVEELVQRFHLLEKGVAIVLVFIAVKILTMDVIHLIGWEHFPTSLSLGVVAVILVGSVVLSIFVPKKKEHESAGEKAEREAIAAEEAAASGETKSVAAPDEKSSEA